MSNYFCFNFFHRINVEFEKNFSSISVIFVFYFLKILLNLVAKSKFYWAKGKMIVWISKVNSKKAVKNRINRKRSNRSNLSSRRLLLNQSTIFHLQWRTHIGVDDVVNSPFLESLKNLSSDIFNLIKSKCICFNFKSLKREKCLQI